MHTERIRQLRAAAAELRRLATATISWGEQGVVLLGAATWLGPRADVARRIHGAADRAVYDAREAMRRLATVLEAEAVDLSALAVAGGPS